MFRFFQLSRYVFFPLHLNQDPKESSSLPSLLCNFLLKKPAICLVEFSSLDFSNRILGDVQHIPLSICLLVNLCQFASWELVVRSRDFIRLSFKSWAEIVIGGAVFFPQRPWDVSSVESLPGPINWLMPKETNAAARLFLSNALRKAFVEKMYCLFISQSWRQLWKSALVAAPRGWSRHFRNPVLLRSVSRSALPGVTAPADH